jgi:hypothetical protein
MLRVAPLARRSDEERPLGWRGKVNQFSWQYLVRHPRQG